MRNSEKYNFFRENFGRLLTFAAPNNATPQNFTEKMFVCSHKNAKFTKVFFLKSFPPYGIDREHPERNWKTLFNTNVPHTKLPQSANKDTIYTKPNYTINTATHMHCHEVNGPPKKLVPWTNFFEVLGPPRTNYF